MSNSVVITSACRTAVGSLGKSLKNISASELGSTVISESFKRSKLKNDDIDGCLGVCSDFITKYR